MTANNMESTIELAPITKKDVMAENREMTMGQDTIQDRPLPHLTMRMPQIEE